jgi:hypothetical protein
MLTDEAMIGRLYSSLVDVNMKLFIQAPFALSKSPRLDPDVHELLLEGLFSCAMQHPSKLILGTTIKLLGSKLQMNDTKVSMEMIFSLFRYRPSA